MRQVSRGNLCWMSLSVVFSVSFSHLRVSAALSPSEPDSGWDVARRAGRKGSTISHKYHVGTLSLGLFKSGDRKEFEDIWRLSPQRDCFSLDVQVWFFFACQEAATGIIIWPSHGSLTPCVKSNIKSYYEMEHAWTGGFLMNHCQNWFFQMPKKQENGSRKNTICLAESIRILVLSDCNCSWGSERYHLCSPK